MPDQLFQLLNIHTILMEHMKIENVFLNLLLFGYQLTNPVKYWVHALISLLYL